MRSRKLKGDCTAADLIDIVQAGEVQIKSTRYEKLELSSEKPFPKEFRFY